MSVAYSMHEGMKNTHKIMVGKHQWKKPFWRSRAYMEQ
jgi:hypothetical protein